ncbi:GNAT family N-acetyltransferase [Devosia sp. LjRoot16]|uniref:GNAT family N-acetyltransferase n=1 Tax=Devosia sp. LjRoot16 TaxID=3342271 RepID=UPI003ECF9E6D
MEIRLKLNPLGRDVAVVRNGLRAYNKQQTGGIRHQNVALLLYDADDKAVGGLTATAVLDWLFVEWLHVPAELRGKGHGRALMAEAEVFARQRGLLGMWLDTFSFQARPFYEKLGFAVFGTLDDHPVGGARYFMQKRFDSASIR